MAEVGLSDIIRCPSGVYRIDAAQRERIVRVAGASPRIQVTVVDGEAIRDRAGFFAALASGLRFPDYFGHNWDAVYDCLTDPSWLPAEVVVLVLEGFAPFAEQQPEQWQIALKVFRDACGFWQPLDRSLYVLLSGVTEEAPDVKILPTICLSAGNDGA